jgi:hypothetical protein
VPPSCAACLSPGQGRGPRHVRAHPLRAARACSAAAAPGARLPRQPPASLAPPPTSPRPQCRCVTSARRRSTRPSVLSGLPLLLRKVPWLVRMLLLYVSPALRATPAGGVGGGGGRGGGGGGAGGGGRGRWGGGQPPCSLACSASGDSQAARLLALWGCAAASVAAAVRPTSLDGKARQVGPGNPAGGSGPPTHHPPDWNSLSLPIWMTSSHSAALMKLGKRTTRGNQERI